MNRANTNTLTTNRLLPGVVLLALFALVLVPAAAQVVENGERDSLRQAIVTMHADTFKVKALINLGQLYETNQPDSAIYFYQQSNRLSIQLEYPAGTISYILNYTGVLNVQGKFDESLKLCLQAVDIAAKNHLQTQMMKALFNTGAAYQYMANFPKAVEYYLKALPYFEQQNEPTSLGTAYTNLAGLYRDLGQPDKAQQYASLGYSYAKRSTNKKALGNACTNLANVLKDAGNIKGAIKYLEQAYELGKDLDDIYLQETALINLGDAWFQLRRPDHYMPFYQKALPLTEEIEDVSGKALVLLGLNFGRFWKQEYKAAEVALVDDMAFTGSHGQTAVLVQMTLLMSDVQLALGHLEVYRRYRQQYDSLYNRVLSEPLLKNIQELETRYGVGKKQKDLLQKDLQLKQKSLQAQRQQQWLTVTAAGIALLLVLLFLGIRLYRQKQQLNARTLQNLQAEQETLRLKAMLEGEQQERKRISREMHDDMGSGLTRMLFLSRTIDQQQEAAGKIGATAEDLIKKMNEIIWVMSNDHDTLDSLLAYIRSGTAEMLEGAGIDHHFNISEVVPDLSLNREFRRNIYLAVKEAVHNIIRHTQATTAHISVHANERLTISVHDNGQGFTPGQERRFGNGMKNMQHRLAQIDGQVEISSGDGTRLTFTAPWPV